MERYLYAAYGTGTIYDGSWGIRNASAYTNVVRYTGREWDPETGIYYYRHRFYQADVGRFFTRDQIGYEPSSNLYEYVGASPATHMDPLGLATEPFPEEIALCCRQAYDNLPDDKKGKVEGQTICCNGVAVTCNFADEAHYKERGFTNPTAIRIFIACVDEHENVHKGDVTCRGARPCYAEPINQGPDFGIWTECKAMLATISCELRKMDEEPCKSDPECQKQVIVHVKGFRDKMDALNCGDVLKKGDPRLGKSPVVRAIGQ